MTRILISVLLLLTIPAASISQENKINIKLSSTDSIGDIKLYMHPLTPASYDIKEALKNSNDQYEVTIEASPNGFYRIIGVKNGAQLFSTLYLPTISKEETLPIELKGNLLFLATTHDNRALGEYCHKIMENGRRMWNCTPNDTATIKKLTKEYFTSADSIISQYKCSSPVEEYIRLWAYTSAYNNFSMVEHSAKRAGYKMNLDKEKLLGNADGIFDSETAAIFPEAYPIIKEQIPRNTGIESKLEYLYNNYKNSAIQKNISIILIEEFLQKHNYEADYEGGKALLSEIIDKYGIDKKYLDEYNKRRATIKGTPFPETVVLRDANGNTVDFSTFKGKYVYIDMWASWCGPCRKEIPHLQQLEKELQNDNVIFVSISIDKDQQAWKQKMIEHDMHGHQLLDIDNQLGQALNVRGIPFFVIYDKEGKLYMHNAPRPSSGTTIKELLQELK